MRYFAALLYSFIFYSFFVVSAPTQPLGTQSTSHRIETRNDGPFRDTSLWKLFNNPEYLPGVRRIAVDQFHFEPWTATTASFVLGNYDADHGGVITIVLNVGAVMLYIPRTDLAAIQFATHSKWNEDRYDEFFKEVYIRTKDGRPGKLTQVFAKAQRDFEAQRVEGLDCLQSLEVWDFRIQMPLNGHSALGDGYTSPNTVARLKTDISEELENHGASVSPGDIEEVPVTYHWKNGRRLSAILFERFPRSMSKLLNNARYRVLLGAQYNVDASKAEADPAKVKAQYLTLIGNLWNIGGRE